MRRLDPHQIAPGADGQVLATVSGRAAWSDQDAASGGAGRWESPLVDYVPADTPVNVDVTTGHAAFPVAVTLRSGRVLTVYRQANGHGWSSTGKLVCRYSDANGATGSWSAEATIYDSAADDGGNHGICQAQDGTVILVSVIRPTSTQSGWYSVALRSVDDGVTWTGPHTIDGGYTAMSNISDVVALPNGELLAGLYGKDSGGSYDYSAAVVSTDGGLTWSRRSTIVNSGTSWWHEPTYVVMPDGEILCFLRWANAGRTLHGHNIARSVDGGHTWTAPRPIITAASGLPAAHLTRNGLLVIAYRDMNGTEYECQWAVSRDRGNTWELRGDFAPQPGWGYVYADWVDLADGDLGCVYALEQGTVGTGNEANVYFKRFARELAEALPVDQVAATGYIGDGSRALHDDGTWKAAGTGAQWEVVMTPGSFSPPVPVETPDGTDWIYVEVST